MFKLEPLAIVISKSRGVLFIAKITINITLQHVVLSGTMGKLEFRRCASFMVYVNVNSNLRDTSFLTIWM